MEKQSGHASHLPCQRIFWDWNGTLLDDLTYAIHVRNRVFPRFGVPVLNDIQEYYSQFAFPIRVYYERAGIPPESFPEAARLWMDEYVRGMRSISLREDALAALEAFRTAGFSQVMLSASDRGILSEQLAQYEIQHFFTAVLGLDHIYATSKQAIGEAYLRESNANPAACLLLGDTLHDAEVAREMGIRCLLIAGGHQSRRTLETAGVPVCDTLMEAAALILAADKNKTSG